MQLDRQKSIDFDSLEQALAHEPKWDIVQIKYDGIWASLEASRVETTWTSRTGNIKKRARTELAPGQYVGEFMFGSHWAQQDAHLGKTYLFDCVWDGANDVRHHDYARRYGLLRHRVYDFGDPTLQVVDNFHIGLAAKLWERICAKRFEGLIFRRSSDPYTASIGRLKREVTCDYVVMGIVPGEGKHLGRMGALVLGLYIAGTLTESLTCGGGFSDWEREDIWRNWPRDCGRVLECKGNMQFPNGALRHPNFIRFRDDKPQSDCVWTIPEE